MEDGPLGAGQALGRSFCPIHTACVSKSFQIIQISNLRALFPEKIKKKYMEQTQFCVNFLELGSFLAL